MSQGKKRKKKKKKRQDTCEIGGVETRFLLQIIDGFQGVVKHISKVLVVIGVFGGAVVVVARVRVAVSATEMCPHSEC